MSGEMPKEYVAELLKQLEQLKKKKAYKERKLQKLKGCSVSDLKKGQTEKTNVSSRKEPDQVLKNDSSETIINVKKSISVNIALEKESFHLFANSEGTHLKNDKEVNACESLKSLNCNDQNKNMENYSADKCSMANDNNIKCMKSSYHSINKTSLNNSEKANSVCKDLISNDTCKTDNFAFIKPDINPKIYTFLKHESVINDDKLKCNSKKSINDESIESDEAVICRDESIKNSIYDVKEKNNHDELPENMEVDFSHISNVIDGFKVNNYSQNENKSSNISNKSLPCSKNKSSDILDDSLNSNMSFFLSADLFATDYIDKKEVVNNLNDNNGTSIKAIKPPFKHNMASKLKDTNTKVSSVNSNSPVNGPQQNILGGFNFPKFSTPTEEITHQSDNDDNMIDLFGKSQSPKLPLVNNKLCTSRTIHTLDMPLKDVSPKNKFDSPQLNYVLEKRLSSVLDAHYESPKKNSDTTSSVLICSNRDSYPQDVTGENVCKKRKLFFENASDVCIETESNNTLCKPFKTLMKTDQEIISDVADFYNMNTFDSDPFSDSKSASDPTVTVTNNCNDISSQIIKTVNGLVARVCEDISVTKPPIDIKPNISAKLNNDINGDTKVDSEILVIPETEGLGLYTSKDTEEFLETSTLSQSMQYFPFNENLLNVSSQSKLESPVVNNIVAAVKSSRIHQNNQHDNKDFLESTPTKDNVCKKVSSEEVLAFNNSLGLDTSFLEDDTEDLGNFKQIPYMNEVDVQEDIVIDESKTNNESNLNFTYSLYGVENEPVIDAEIIVFGTVKYAVIQHKTHIYVWRQEKNMQWIRTFSHQIEDMFSLEKMCLSMDNDNLVIVMLLSNEQQYCLQFLIFEKDARVIKLMENTHWLEERHSKDSIFLCGLNGLMFAIAQNKENSEVSIHAFISLKENPRLMTAVLGSTETPLCSLCKIDKLPNALLGLSDSMLYVWHILEARLVTSVSLHPRDYIPIKECFWATVENGLIYFLTTCEGKDNHQVCQLLAANLATGFCQSAMTYSTLPSNDNVNKIIKAAYLEPFLVIAHSNGAFIWSVMEEFCGAALSSKSSVSTIAISRDIENWGILAVGSKLGHIDCYSLN